MRGLTVLVAATIAAAAITLTACRTIETQVPPVELAGHDRAELPDVERWWTQFNDPQLTR